MDWPSVSAAFAPILGWAFYVERRISKLETMKETLDKVDNKVEMLVEKLIVENPRKAERR